MSDIKQVKVDNWGIYFLQRLKHFFNRTDYCDLTLQFQDNAQLKVHRLVLSACTEYFELLERTCEMYEDCLVMPDDLQADVVVPIVNFMYTGQLEFKLDLLDSLYQTSQIMNMPVLTKLLDAHRSRGPLTKTVLNYSNNKRCYSKNPEPVKTQTTPMPSSSNASINKRSYSKAFGSPIVPSKEKKHYRTSSSKPEVASSVLSHDPMLEIFTPKSSNILKKTITEAEPRPTRYELPEELESDNIFEDSFSNISYTSQPLMVHPETVMRYPAKKTGIFTEASSSKRFGGASTLDIVECKKIGKDNIFDDEEEISPVEIETFQQTKVKEKKVSNQLFDQILEHQDGPKVTIETKDNKEATNIDHAKIISEVLKKYPHLVKSNKNIKLKILNTPNPKQSNKSNKKRSIQPVPNYPVENIKSEMQEYTFETDVLDSKEAARLIAMGAENVAGPWICLICGTPGKALHFTSYYNFRRHLVDVHNEKPVSKICEYCGLKSLKRNYLLHHLYTKHGVEPPPSYHFPKCNLCNYVALTKGFLVKHKLGHSESMNFKCNVCATTFNTSNQLLTHIQKTGHKYGTEKKSNLQCIYCLKVFTRDANLYAHIKTNHKEAALADGIIEESDEEKQDEISEANSKVNIVKYEPPNFESEYEQYVDGKYQIQQRPDGNIQLISKKSIMSNSPTKQKILNSDLSTPVVKPVSKPVQKLSNNTYELPCEIDILNKNTEDIVVIDNNEYVMRDNQLIPRKRMITSNDHVVQTETDDSSTSIEFTNANESIPEDCIHEQKVIMNRTENLNQPIEIVVSNEEEYKALMGSNHSIIFDSGEENKTLTVLNAAENTTLNTTTIDLDNSRSNDMVIIPENYPLTVSETLPEDNSNIVVVYSHPVDGENKGEYQLITTQGIETQFVQTSAVITTQNYESITSTPVVSAHVIDTQEVESWQNTVQENIIQNQHLEITPVTEIAEIAVIEQSEITPVENATINNLDELPEVTLTNISQKSAMDKQSEIIYEGQISEKSAINEQPEVIQSGDTNNEIDKESNEITSEELQKETTIENTMEVNVSTETVISNENSDISSDIINTSQNTLQSKLNEVPSYVVEEELVDQSAIIEHGPEIEEGIEEANEHIETDQLNSTNTISNQEIIDNPTSNPREQDDIEQIIPSNNNGATLTKVTKEHIETLASEWSEDEDDTEQTSCNPDKLVKDIQDNNLVQATELEESIENIQQEMEKDLNKSSEKGHVAMDVNSSKDISTNSKELQPTTKFIIDASQEKISSLLNDWDDNDSQEGNDSNATETIDSSCAKQNLEHGGEKQGEQKSDDKIKSLVSDWDDEEDDNKT